MAVHREGHGHTSGAEGVRMMAGAARCDSVAGEVMESVGRGRFLRLHSLPVQAYFTGY